MDERDEIPLTPGIKIALALACVFACACNWVAVALLGPH